MPGVRSREARVRGEGLGSIDLLTPTFFSTLMFHPTLSLFIYTKYFVYIYRYDINVRSETAVSLVHFYNSRGVAGWQHATYTPEYKVS